MAWLQALAIAFFTALLNVFRQGVNDARNATTQQELGAAKQKQADSDAAVEAKRQADEVALQPTDRPKTIKDLRDGNF